MDDNWSGIKVAQEGCSKKVTMAIYVIEVTDFKSEVKFDLRGCLEAEITISCIFYNKGCVKSEVNFRDTTATRDGPIQTT